MPSCFQASCWPACQLYYLLVHLTSHLPTFVHAISADQQSNISTDSLYADSSAHPVINMSADSPTYPPTSLASRPLSRQPAFHFSFANLSPTIQRLSGWVLSEGSVQGGWIVCLAGDMSVYPACSLAYPYSCSPNWLPTHQSTHPPSSSSVCLHTSPPNHTFVSPSECYSTHSSFFRLVSPSSHLSIHLYALIVNAWNVHMSIYLAAS